MGTFSTDIQIKLGIDKCKRSCLDKGLWLEHTGYEVKDYQGFIGGISEEEQYKYLRYLQRRDLDPIQVK